MTVDIGSKAPDFSLAGIDGTVTLKQFRGRKLVLYFYPQADTPSCTTENRDFSSLAGEFEAAGTALLGVSRDPVKKIERFREKFGLNAVLATDEPGTMVEAYGVWVEKSMYGRSYMGLERATFLIDAQGRVARVWRKVRTKGHAEEVLAAARAL
jgi:thioredoxin-dependent peroxiredoxin